MTNHTPKMNISSENLVSIS